MGEISGPMEISEISKKYSEISHRNKTPNSNEISLKFKWNLVKFCCQPSLMNCNDLLNIFFIKQSVPATWWFRYYRISDLQYTERLLHQGVCCTHSTCVYARVRVRACVFWTRHELKLAFISSKLQTSSIYTFHLER